MYNLNEIELCREEQLGKLRKTEQKLYSIRVQSYWENHGTPDEKEKFISEREDLTLSRIRLENLVLDKIIIRFKALEGDLKDAREDVEHEIEQLNNTVALLNTIARVTGIIARILLLV